MSQLDSGPNSSGMMTTSSCFNGLVNFVSDGFPTQTRKSGRTNVLAGSNDSVLRPVPLRLAVWVMRLVGSEPRGSTSSTLAEMMICWRFGSGVIDVVVSLIIACYRVRRAMLVAAVPSMMISSSTLLILVIAMISSTTATSMITIKANAFAMQC